MKRIKLTVAYDGTNYCGWQVQPNGITIEEVLNKNLTKLLKEDIKVIGASRTDSGVHALANVAVFNTNARMPGEKISFALNQRLPEDITIQGSEEVPHEFHPRFCNSVKTYEYRILNRTFNIPSYRFNTHFIYMPLDVELMKQAAGYLKGRHDFQSFCTPRTHITDFVREIYALDVKKEDDIITIRISGSGFLYNMVRIITGTLINAGLKNHPPEYVLDILEKKDRKEAGPTAPAKGLTLIKIDYPPDDEDISD